MSYKQCEFCHDLMPNSLAQYCFTCNEKVLEQLRQENKRLREALELASRKLHSFYDVYGTTEIEDTMFDIDESLEETK